jgi:signal transduction histidine kinase
MAGAALMDQTFRVGGPLSAGPKAPLSLRQELAALANLTAAAVNGPACAIRWRGVRGSGVAGATPGSRWGAILDAVAARMEIHEPTMRTGAVFRLDSAGLDSLIGGPGGGRARYEAAATVAERGGLRAMVGAIIGETRSVAEMDALLSLAADSALRIVESHEDERARDFWRRRAIDLGDRFARTKADAERRELECRRIDEAAAAAVRLRPRNRFSGLGAIFAGMGPFAAWIVAASEDGELRPAAASAVLARIPLLSGDSVMAESLRTGSAVHRSPGDSGVQSEEDRLFAGFASYVCVPLGAAAIALASRERLDPATLASVETLGHRVEPIVRDWSARAEIERLRRLVRNLGFRMFGAIDAERARIARDLHDHQAQLLAAARIALEAGPDEARGIFKQVEDALRLRVRELRPALLGRTTLADALRYELRRLADAGIKGRLVGAKRMNSLTRPVQQLCYQVAREALSNVIRHSGAARTHVSVEKRGGRVFLTIFDDGKGVAYAAVENRAGRMHEGVGLSGVGERLEMMGGKVEIESRAGATRVIAEIPEPD